jgi:hypothetical protein
VALKSVYVAPLKFTLSNRRKSSLLMSSTLVLLSTRVTLVGLLELVKLSASMCRPAGGGGGSSSGGGGGVMSPVE